MNFDKNIWNTDDADELLLAILHLKNLSEARAFFRDLLPHGDASAAVRRWKVARMLSVGMEYKKIQRVTGVSSATVARIRSVMRHGAGGFREMLKKIHP